jgi:hypothetical protein
MCRAMRHATKLLAEVCEAERLAGSITAIGFASIDVRSLSTGVGGRSGSQSKAIRTDAVPQEADGYAACFPTSG